MATSLSSDPTRFDSADEPRIAGPFILFDGSFVLEFLQPRPERQASVLMRATYNHAHPLCKAGKKFVQAPPLHIHLMQSESLVVLSGRVGTTTTYGLIDTIHTPETANETNPYEITPMLPHTFWPDPTVTEDTTFLIKAHPSLDGVDARMDRLFFQSLLNYISDVAEKKVQMDILQIMLIQHVSATAMVVFPGAWFLGPLRWWVPWKLQALGSTIARWQGKKTLIQRYLSKEDWEEAQPRVDGRPKTA